MRILFFVPLALASIQACAPGNYVTDSGDCVKCPKGFFQSQPDQSGCIPCPAISITPNEGATACIECPPNEVAAPWKDECECKPGFLFPGSSNGVGSGGCEPCPRGSHTIVSRYPISFRTCVPCGENEIAPELGQAECQACLLGQIAAQNSTVCVSCQAGEEFVEGRCTKCPPGTYYDSYEEKCTACAPGTFKPVEGNYRCLPCPLSMTSNESAIECFQLCPSGTAQMKDGTCGTCPPGSYYSVSDKQCEECSYDRYMPYINVRSECYPCGADSYSTVGATTCICRDSSLNSTCTTCS